MLLLAASLASAQVTKLDPKVRLALSSIEAGATPQTLRANAMSVTDEGALDVFITGNITREELEAMGVTVRTALPGIFTAYVPASLVDQVAANAHVTAIHGASLCEQYLDVSVPTTGANTLRGAGPAFAGVNGAGVLVGDVDSGIDIHHADFRDAGNLSRILYVWDQNNTSSVVPPSGYSYGHEWTKADIDAGTCTETDGGTLASGSGHGTHVMGIAAGDGSAGTSPYLYAGMAPQADIAMVATTFYDSAILDGVAYIFGRATATGKNAVVNLSLGSQYGPHDGSSPFEAGLDALSGPGRVITVAAGNDRGTSSATFIHAGMDAPAAGDSMKFVISGGTTSGRGVEFNGWYNAPDDMTIKLRTPNNLIITLAPGQSYGTLSGTTGWPTNNTGVNGRIYMENALYSAASGAREVYLIMQASGTGVNGLNGTWTIYATPTSMAGATSRFDIYRDYVSTTSLGCYFSLKQGNDHMTAEPSNARRVITVGAWETKNSWVSCNAGGTYSYTGAPAVGSLCSFSNQGPSRDGYAKPDIAAPGMGIGSARSADATGTCSAYPYQLNDGAFHTINQGTSMAAPHVAGATALLMQKYGAWTPEQVKTYLAANATHDAFTGIAWNTDFGNGKLHLGDLVDPTVSVVAENGGETVYIGASVPLQWSAADNVGVTSVDLYLSRTGPSGPWETIATGLPNTGSYPWLVDGTPSADAWLRVVAYDAAGNTAQDQSDAAFFISLDATPTLLATFVANAVTDGIELRWQIDNNTSFRNVTLERAPSAIGPWSELSATPSRDGEQYVVVDGDVESGTTYSYRLRATASNGSIVTLGTITGTAGAALTQFAVTRVAPNPSHGDVNVEFTVPQRANVKVTVLDVQGREVATLANGAHVPGRYQVLWSGELNGQKAPSGLYFVRLQAPGVHSVRRVTITH